VPTVSPGRILGHEAVGTVTEIGAGVNGLNVGDRVLASCISACGVCRYCRERSFGQCLGGGGWILGHVIDGVQAEYARIPFADQSTYKLGPGISNDAAVLLADILPTSYEVGCSTATSSNVTITTGLVDTYSTPQLLDMVVAGQIDTGHMVTHRFALDQIIEAYDVFVRPAQTGALKVVLART
jgi:threonine dehydrogenase-like Zn-dependent dehydrogenase